MFPLAVFNILRLTVSNIPVRMGYFLARKLAIMHYCCFPARRAAVLSNVRHILSNCPSPRFRELGDRHVATLIFRSFNEFLYEFFKIPSLDRQVVKRIFRLEGLANLDAALANGRGVIIATAHIGNWEMAGAALALLGYRLHIVAGIQFSSSLSEHVKNMKRKLGISMVSPEEGYRTLFRALRNNEVVVLLVDGDVFVNGLRLEFFSKPARIPSGAATLSLKTKAPIVPGYIRREGPFQFRICVDEPIFPNPTGDKAADVQELSRQVLCRIESYIDANLDQWCIFRDVWASPSKQRVLTEINEPENHAFEKSAANG